MSSDSYKIIFAAGGTGGHLYPAVAVAEKLKAISPNSKILFVGTKKKIESVVIPKMGYAFKTIWISGFSRRLVIKNILFPLKLIISILQSLIINLNYKPNVAVGAGAYVSGPIAWIAWFFGTKIVLLEQNSFPGLTNRILEGKADSIHISFDDSRKYFKNSAKLKLTGNPVRPALELANRSEIITELLLDDNKKVLLIIGGSLGAKSLNAAVAENLNVIINNNIQIIWQTGEQYYEEYKSLENKCVKVMPFISDIGKMYSACDLLLARAGATTIAEVAYLGLPVIFVPSPNVAANHQYKNAKSLEDTGAGLIIKDSDIFENLGDTIVNTIFNEELLKTLRANIKKYAKPNAAEEIALDVLRLAQINKSELNDK